MVAKTEAGALPAVRLKGLTKRFGAVLANDRIDLEIAPATIHAIIGENGAGKSTLVSMLYGLHTADAGSIEIDGREVAIRSSADAIALGIGMVHQHFMLVPTFTVLENVALGHEGGFRLAPGRRAIRDELARLSAEYGLEVDPDAVVGDLAVGLQQRVEILKALRAGARLLILDEPTGVLTPAETDRFFDILRTLRDRGVTVVLITHKLREVMALSTRVSVMRRGRMVAHRETATTSREELASLMVERAVTLRAERVPARPGAVALSAEGLSWRDRQGVRRLDDVSFEVRAGEILGLAGVAGNGQSELLDLLAGIAPVQEGTIRVAERLIDRTHPADPAEMRRLGLAHVPEDRHARALVLGFEARHSGVLGYHETPAAGASRWLSPKTMRAHTERLMQGFDVRPPTPLLKTAGFSGGNQQKLVLAREIDPAPKVLLIGQPTRGVDIGGIEFIHRRIQALKSEGCAIVLVSVELDEILALSDRIAVINQGQLVGIRAAEEADVGEIGLMMAGQPAPREARA
ncbi:MAG: ABC transporter ATP-binding protein [Pseudomonadota bacterium]